MNKLVILKNKQAVTTSLQVAETFGKQHKDVLEAYDNLMQQGWRKIPQTYFMKIPTFIRRISKHIVKSS